MSPIELKINDKMVMDASLGVGNKLSISPEYLEGEMVRVERIDEGDYETYDISQGVPLSETQSILISEIQNKGEFMIGSNTIKARFKK